MTRPRIGTLGRVTDVTESSGKPHPEGPVWEITVEAASALSGAGFRQCGEGPHHGPG